MLKKGCSTRVTYSSVTNNVDKVSPSSVNPVSLKGPLGRSKRLWRNTTTGDCRNPYGPAADCQTGKQQITQGATCSAGDKIFVVKIIDKVFIVTSNIQTEICTCRWWESSRSPYYWVSSFGKALSKSLAGTSLISPSRLITRLSPLAADSSTNFRNALRRPYITLSAKGASAGIVVGRRKAVHKRKSFASFIVVVKANDIENTGSYRAYWTGNTFGR